MKFGDDVLRKKCREVTKFDEKLAQLLDDMKETLQAADGVGLAAPQVGILRRAVVIDVHDIGKNIVKTLLENYGFEVIDLGKDVEYEAVAEAAEKTGAGLVGLSALMTTTLKSMENTIKLIHERKIGCKIVVGGAVLTPDYAAKIGADFYAKDAKETVDIAKKIYE